MLYLHTMPEIVYHELRTTSCHLKKRKSEKLGKNIKKSKMALDILFLSRYILYSLSPLPLKKAVVL